MYEQEKNLNLKEFSPLIETIKTDGNEISFWTKRGGIIISLKIKNQELLYMEEETLFDWQKNVRGGIPILFPNAGPINGNEFPKLKQHGFGRLLEWKMEEITKSKFSETLISNDVSKEIYPYDFKLTMAGEIENDGSISIVQNITNLEKDKSMPISMGLHPYFKVPNAEKKNIKFDFEVKAGKSLKKMLINGLMEKLFLLIIQN